jgi:peptidoglycan hydrolase-like protein with peptidoglycan-binding domain
MVWQDDLKARWGYTGRIDGIPGPMTHAAIQRYAEVPVTGRLDDRTRRAVQKKIGVIPDGVWGRNTWSEIQRRLNVGDM